MAHPSSDDPDFPGTPINPPYKWADMPTREHACKTEGCHGTTLEVYCDDCLGDGVDPDPPKDA